MECHCLLGEGIREHLPSLYQEGKEAKSTVGKGSEPMVIAERVSSLDATDFPPLKVLKYLTAEIIGNQ